MLARSSPFTAAIGLHTAVFIHSFGRFSASELEAQTDYRAMVEVLMKPLERPFDTFENMAPA
jgi:hypothetical protein